jgi:hypothetical protein
MYQVVVLSDGVCAVVVGSTDTAVVLAVEADNGMAWLHNAVIKLSPSVHTLHVWSLVAYVHASSA